MKNALKLFLFCWIAYTPIVVLEGLKRGVINVYTFAEAAGGALWPFLLGLIYLFSFRAKPDKGLKGAMITALVMIVFLYVGSLSQGI